MKNRAAVAVPLVVSILASLGFAALYVAGGGTQLEGTLLWLAFGGLAAAFVMWEMLLMPHPEAAEERESLPSDPGDREAAAVAFASGGSEIVGRRSWLVALLAGAVGALGIGALFPLRSMTAKGVDAVARTGWSKGLRLVREDGTPVRFDDLDVGSVLTVFPEGHVGPDKTHDMANSATMLVRVVPSELQLGERAGWAPHGCVAYSKVCTHAGCPVGLYRAAAQQLFCPCHQSSFDVLRGGAVTFGPAARALPQLPLDVRSDGTLIARGDFPEAIGPGYWERA